MAKFKSHPNAQVAHLLEFGQPNVFFVALWKVTRNGFSYRFSALFPGFLTPTPHITSDLFYDYK